MLSQRDRLDARIEIRIDGKTLKSIKGSAAKARLSIGQFARNAFSAYAEALNAAKKAAKAPKASK